MPANEDYDSIRIELAYDYNANTTYFDGIQLFREEYGTSYTYNDKGDVISVIDLQKLNTTYEYNTTGDLAKIIQDGQTKMTYTYDTRHNVKTATSQENLSYSFEYDAYGNNTKVSITSDGKTMSSRAEYTDDGNYLDYTLDALGNKTDYTYDAQTGELESVKYPNGAGTTTTYTYDEMYRLISAAASTGTQNLSDAYTYTDDYLTKITTGSTEYNFTYGVFGLRTSVQAGSRTLATYEYTYDPDGGDRNKYLKELLYGNGNVIEYIYDSYGRVIGEIYKDEGDSTPNSEKETVTYKYDNDGLLASVQDSESGRTTAYSYDLTGRLVKYRETATGYDHSVSYTYDQKNNLTQLTEKLGTDIYTTGYGYDDDNRITSVTSNGGTTATTDDITVAYSYDGFGRVHSQQTKKGSGTVLTRAYTFSQGKSSNQTTGQVASLTVTGSGYNAAYTYEYDANGNITKITQGSTVTEYTYDSQNQLIREDNQAAGKIWEWEYDAAGNIKIKKQYNRSTGALEDTVSYGYDDTGWGDLLTAYNGTDVTYDQIGNPNSLNGRSYIWEHGRELATVSYNGTTWTNTYDANGMRTQRKSSSATYSYIYNGSQLTQMTYEGNTLYFAYDATGTPMSVTYNGTVYYYATNLQGDITAILSNSGTSVVTYTYDAWGKLLSTDGSMKTTLGVHNPLRYRGYVYDTETGLYYLQSRYYDPEVGRFINGDDLAFLGEGGLVGYNLFAYCGNKPVGRTDPQGNLFKELLQEFSKTLSNASGYFALAGLISQVDSPVLFFADIICLAMITVGAGYCAFQAASIVLTSLNSTVMSTTGEKAIEEGLSDIAKVFGTFKCKEAAEKMAEYLKKHGKKGEIITITFLNGIGYIWSETAQAVISENGVHVGVLYNGIVYCNVHPFGLHELAWISDFEGTGEKVILRVPIT